MKKLLTLLLFVFFALSAYTQVPPTCLFLTNQVPFAPADADHTDQLLFDLIKSFGYQVTAEAISATSATTGYDVIVTSEAIGSGDANWIRYNTAPSNMISFKVHAIKSSALGWISSENTGTDYDNTVDSVIVKVNDHPILTGFPESSIKCFDKTTAGANATWVNIPPTSGITVVTRVAMMDGWQNIVAMNPGTILNGKTLTNRAVIVGFHQVSLTFLNDNGKKIIKNSLEWARTGNVVSGVTNNETIVPSVYPNPVSNGIVNISFDHMVTDIKVNIISLDGRIHISKQLTNVQSETLDVSELQNGLYIIDIKGSEIRSSMPLNILK